MKDSSSTILFHLLRAALGNEAVGALPSDIDWQEVIDLSFDQGVAAIAVDGLGFAHDNDDDNWMRGSRSLGFSKVALGMAMALWPLERRLQQSEQPSAM